MSLVAILAEVKSVLAAVTDVGSNVYDYERWSSDWKGYLDLFKADGLIKGWTITRSRTDESKSTMTTNMRNHNFIIRGVYGLDDSAASEKAFQTIIENIATAFRTESTLNGTAHGVDPLQVEVVGMTMFGDVLCHFCQLRLVVDEEEQWR